MDLRLVVAHPHRCCQRICGNHRPRRPRHTTPQPLCGMVQNLTAHLKRPYRQRERSPRTHRRSRSQQRPPLHRHPPPLHPLHRITTLTASNLHSANLSLHLSRKNRNVLGLYSKNIPKSKSFGIIFQKLPKIQKFWDFIPKTSQNSKVLGLYSKNLLNKTDYREPIPNTDCRQLYQSIPAVIDNQTDLTKCY